MATKGEDDYQWMNAADALRLLSPHYLTKIEAQEALIDLASMGIVLTWCQDYAARRDHPDLATNDKHHVPKAFWARFDAVAWREGQDWTLGNFTLRGEVSLEYQYPPARAFGVMFSGRDLRKVPQLQALFRTPADPLEDDDITQEQFESWYPPKVVLRKFASQMNAGRTVAVLLYRISQRDLVTRARKMTIESERQDPSLLHYARTHPDWWPGPAKSESNMFWDTGDIIFEDRRPSMTRRQMRASCVEVRFEPTAIDRLHANSGVTAEVGPSPEEVYQRAKALAEGSPSIRPAPPNRRQRGPKAKPFWGDAMDAVKADITSERISVSSLADVERALLGWLVDHEENAAESTIRRYAAKVWGPFDSEGR